MNHSFLVNTRYGRDANTFLLLYCEWCTKQDLPFIGKNIQFGQAIFCKRQVWCVISKISVAKPPNQECSQDFKEWDAAERNFEAI